DWARRQEVLSWELRAAMSLARLWRSQGRLGDARDQLASVYGRFTEGFETADLRTAKQLLDELPTARAAAIEGGFGYPRPAHAAASNPRASSSAATRLRA